MQAKINFGGVGGGGGLSFTIESQEPNFGQLDEILCPLKLVFNSRGKCNKKKCPEGLFMLHEQNLQSIVPGR